MAEKLTIKQMQEIAKKRSGECLSDKYVNSTTKLRWKCKSNHEWMATPKSIRLGNWCSECSGKKKQTLEDMIKIAKSHGGLCLSNKYVNESYKLKWQCKKGHVWETTPHTVKRGKWCPTCGHSRAGKGRRDTIELMQKIAKKRGGKCLSKEYILSNKKLKWQCKERHTWQSIPNSIKNGTWCPECAKKSFGSTQRLDLEEMHKIAKSKGGKCLSESYENARSKIKWQCKVGHVWGAIPSTVKKGTWCPKCSEGVSERICCKFFEELFGTTFPKKYPSWLKTSKGKIMELDGYSEKFKVAFEYQGIQHYEAIPYFNKVHDVKEIKKRDKLKKKRCSERGILLIQVPYSLEYDEIPGFIIKECKENGIKIPNKDKNLDYKLFDIYSLEKLKLMNEMAKLKQGKCLSEEYINDRTKLEWECSNKHKWIATPSNIKRGKWCPYCVGFHQTINDMKILARKFGGDCISPKYIKNNVKLRWRCKKGHEWGDTPAHVKFNRWCKICKKEDKKEK